MIKAIILFIVVNVGCGSAFAQHSERSMPGSGKDRGGAEIMNLAHIGEEAEQKIRAVISNVYNASVFMGEYDTIRKAINGRFSGVVVSEDGLIMTAAHTCMPGKKYQVLFPDGRKCMATALGRLGKLDAALMKIDEAGKWPYAEMGWSSSMKLNEICINIAYPGTFSSNQPIIRVGYLADTISLRRAPRLRTTCLMEPGDSGGPIFDILGRVVGVCSSINLPLEDNFEVPVDIFRKYWTALKIPKDYRELPEGDVVPVDPLRDQRWLPALYPEINKAFQAWLPGSGSKAITVESLIKDTITTAMGTVVSPEKSAGMGNTSFIISKSSIVGDQPKLLLANGDKKMAKVVARNTDNDLVLLSIEGQLSGINKSSSHTDSMNFSQLGGYLFSPLPASGAVQVSIVGSSETSLPRSGSSGQLGVYIEVKDAGLFISRVAPNTAAIDAALKEGDQIITLNGLALKSQEAFTKSMQQYDPGDKITLAVMRDDSAFTKEITLRKRPARQHIADQFLDGRSVRREGFTNAFVHDAKIKPDECGGPVFDREGRFRGINIARASRTSSIAIPAAAVWKFVEEVLK